MRGANERDVGVVTPEQRVDRVERRRVVPMRAPRGEDGREVEDVHAEHGEVVEVLLDPGQVAAEPLEGRLGTASGRKLVPAREESPIRAASRRGRRTAKRSGKTW